VVIRVSTNKTVIPFEYDKAMRFSDGIAVVEKNGTQRTIDRSNKVTNTTVVLEFVKIGKKWGIIDLSSENQTPCILQYEPVGVLLEELVIVKNKGLLGLADKNGKIILPLKYSYMESFSDGLIIVGITKVKGSFLDALAATSTSSSSITIGDTKYTTTTTTTDLSKIRTREIVSEGVIDKNGKMIIPVKNGQRLERKIDGVFKEYKAYKTSGFNTEYKPTGKYYGVNGKILNESDMKSRYYAAIIANPNLDINDYM